ncbi:serine protease [Tardiphaga sp. P9-11]|nr:serine protease [Tardiphaga sp. P9-11]
MDPKMLIYAPVKLSIKRKIDVANEILVAIATGFFWKHGDNFYLITNWHNVTGWDQLNNRSMSPSAVQPTHIQMPLLLKSDITFEGKSMAARKRYDISLYNIDGMPAWLEHPVFGSQVDVVALKIAQLDDSLVSRPINSLDDFVDFDPRVGDDVFVLGYPGGLDGGNELAIWKRGSIASQPLFNIDQLPKLLIDTAIRKGMSGSPVIARQTGIIVPKGTPRMTEGALSGSEIIGQADKFLGIYSGRIGDDEFGLQLGIVWKASVLDEIVGGGQPGKSPH